MKTLRGFVLGFIAGGVIVYFAPRYHIVRTDEGVQVVPKISSSFANTYVDIREFGFAEWSDHKLVAAALVASDKSYILEDAGEEGVLEGFQDILLGKRDETETR